MEVGFYIVSASVLKYLLLYFRNKKLPPKARLVGTVSELRVFPVKSMSGLNVGQAFCTHTGVVCGDIYDRHWMVTTADYNFVSGRGEPKLPTIKISLHGDVLHLQAEGKNILKLPVRPDPSSHGAVCARVWGQRIQCLDGGDEASDWITEFLQHSVRYRLVYCPPGQERDVAKGRAKRHWTAKMGIDKAAFHDGFPYLLLSEPSLTDLNRRLEKPESMSTFRPNIVANGCNPYDEDKWREVFIGDVKFTNNNKCPRCSFTTIDQEKGAKNKTQEPLVTLRTYRLLVPEFAKFPCFGVNMLLDRPGIIHVGDEIYALPDDNSNF